MVRFSVYASASLLACAGLLYYTYITRLQFYPAVIYLVTSKISVLVLGNAGLVLTILFARLVKTIFLGTLRDAEVELLHENVRYAITETCLALTIFRDEINFHVVVLFTSLVFLKVFHWLSQSRIEFIEQSDVVSRFTHTRLVALVSSLFVVDLAFVVMCGLHVADAGPSVFMLFGFEFLILLITLVATALRYVLHAIDAHRDGNWPSKFTYLFYLELIAEVVKLVIYLVFFLLIFSYYGMPLHIVRDLWVSIKTLQRRIASYFRYRKITAQLNDRFPNPTADELDATDRICIICREEMASDGSKKLPCAHIFHVDCLKMWVQRQQTCPTCRSTIPTGPAPPPVPPPVPQAQQQAPEGPAAPVQPAAAPVQPAAAPVLPPAAPAAADRFRFGHAAADARAAAQPAAAAPIAPLIPPVHQHQQQQQNGTVAAAAAAGHAQLPQHQQQQQQQHPLFPHPFAAAGVAANGLLPQPFLSPFALPGAAPFGYPMLPFNAYGMLPPGQSPLMLMDPEMLQRQIELLHAQLAMLQATAAAAAAGHTFQHPPQQPLTTPPLATATAAASAAVASPPVPTTPATVASAPPAVVNATDDDDDDNDELEDKSPVPTAAVEQRVPPAPQTEAERRREELRRRYNRIYTGAAAAESNTNSNSTTTEETTDESKRE